MIKTLNIVNGDTCIKIMKEAEIVGDFLPWQDFLHEGFVSDKLTLESLSLKRAEFISSYGLGQLKDIEKDFKKRDEKLNSYKLYDKVILWFEHDLYDQLQLLQLLSWFATRDLKKTKLTLISTNNYLGESSISQIKKLLNYEITILQEHFYLAQEAWSAFCHNTPKKWANLLNKPTALLPYLNGAVFRMLEEYPNTKCCLSRSEYQALHIISNGIDDPLDLFEKCQSFEERKFMGDVLFWRILENFEKYKVINKYEQKLTLTTLGKKLLQGEENWLNIKPLQHSIGGVELSFQNLWCWDMEQKNIHEYYYSKALNSLLKVK